jgi:hypothetical protein
MKVPDRDGADAVEAVPLARFAAAAVPGDFDLSADGRVLAYTREELRGDIWLLESGRTTY